MALEVIRTSPSVVQYTSLSDHQAQTPTTFGQRVLYYHSPNSTLTIERVQLLSQPAFSNLQSHEIAAPPAPVNGDAHSPEQSLIENIDVWVASDFFTLFARTTSTGVRIPYPSISLHAQQTDALYMQLSLSDPRHTADEDLETLELLLRPGEQDTSQASGATEGGEQELEAAEGASQSLYKAVSACADLHPDPTSEDEDEEARSGLAMGMGMMGGSMPGAGGWITSENMHEFVDDEGNFRMPPAATNGGGTDGAIEGNVGGVETGLVSGALGTGAGSRRTAEQFEDAEVEEGADGDEEEETKWRRTG